MISRRGWAFERGVLWAIDLAREAAARVLPRIAVIFDEVHGESVESLTRAMDLSDPKPVQRRFSNGRRCFAGWIEDQIAVYGWVSQDVECVGELEREFQMQTDEAYIWDCVTLPAYRRQRLYSALLSHIVAELNDEGVRRVWIGSSLANQPSIRGFVNAGFQPVINLTYMRLFNVCCLWMRRYSTAPDTLTAAARRVVIADYEYAWGTIVVGRSPPAQLPRCAQIEV